MLNMFERTMTRRTFVKTCAWFGLGGILLPGLARFAAAQDARLGYVKAKKALHYEKLGDGRIRCTLCPRRCVVGGGERGFCRVRENRGGEYYTLVHSNPCAVHIDPIEKKPLFHFLPGTMALSIATAGCNFTCKNCQNHDISQARPDDTVNLPLSPQDIVDLAKKHATPTIAYTYTEPTIFFEYMLDTARRARRSGVLNIYHSNGYISEEALSELAPYLDGANIDLKAFSDAFYAEITGGTLEPVLASLKTLKDNGVWLEITNLVIPGKNDSDEMISSLCRWVRGELGSDTPLHFSRFYPQYKLQNIPPTPVETLKKAAGIARQHGIRYIYIGNVPGLDEENTRCPECGEVIIARTGYTVHMCRVVAGRCDACGMKIAGKW